MNKVILVLISIAIFEANGFAESLFLMAEKIEENKTIREFRNKNGQVFAIGWAGTTELDSYQTMSKYWGSLDPKSIVVEKHGKRHFFWGRIYVPKYVPGGIDLDKIK